MNNKLASPGTSSTAPGRFDHEGDDLVREFLSPEDLRMSPEEYAARNAHKWGLFSLHFYRFRDPALEKWVKRFAEIFASSTQLDACRQKFLTPAELAEVKRQEAEGL